MTSTAGSAGFNAAFLAPPIRDWHCPNCGMTKRTQKAEAHTPFHPCPKLRGVLAPFLPAGVAGRLELREREDYVGDDLVQTDGEGRPLMSVVTHRDNGQDCTVFAPTATVDGDTMKEARNGLV